jgi:tetratricopeptide (TPR) repeat protein
MQTLAEPGTTYVTEDVFKLTEGFFRFESLGDQPVKGMEKPVAVYQVLAPSTRSTRFEVNAERGLSAFVGRQRELELLLDGYERAKSGRGQAFSIVAEAGVGKTRLVYEFRKALANEDVAIREGRCLSYSQNEAYHPIVDVLKSHFNISEDDNDLQIKDKVHRVLKAINGDQLSLTPYLLELLNVKESGIDPALSPEERKQRFISALKQLTLKGSEVRPTILIIEDLHWMDKTSEEVLKEIFESIAGSAVLLIFTFRPEYVHTWGAKTYHSQITLNRLSNRESLMMISDLLDNCEVDPVLQELILEKTEGVPFFIEELIKSLTQLQVIEKKDNRYQLSRDIQKVSIPSTIQDVIMARVDALPERAKKVIQAGSAIEREFSYELIKQVVNMPQEELLSNLAILKDIELIYERGIYPKSGYVFKHALTQEVVYSSILKDRAKKYHEKIAKAIENIYAERLEEVYASLAYHYSQSDNQQKAYEYFKLSGIKASDNYANQEACNFFKDALELLNRMPDTTENKKKKIEIIRLIYAPITLIGFPDDSLEIFQKGEELAREMEDKKSLSSMMGHISNYYVHKGNPLEGIKYVEPRFYEAKQVKDIDLMASLSPELCYSYEECGYHYKVSEILLDLIDLLEKNNRQNDYFDMPFNIYPHLLIRYGNSLLHTGYLDKELCFLEKGVIWADKNNDKVSTGLGHLYFSQLYIYKGYGNKAIEYSQKGLKYFEEANYPFLAAFSGYYSAAGCHLLGDLETALKYVEKGYDMQKKISVNYAVPWYPNLLVKLHMDSGSIIVSQRYAEESFELSLKGNNRFAEGYSRYLLGRILGKIDVSKVNEAERNIIQGIMLNEELKLRPFMSEGHLYLGELYADIGEHEKALEWLKKAESQFKDMGMEYDLSFCKSLIGKTQSKIKPSRFNEAEQTIFDAIKIAQDIESKPASAQGYRCLGEIYADNGQKEKALENLKKAEAMYQDMKMGLWLGETREVLARL